MPTNNLAKLAMAIILLLIFLLWPAKPLWASEPGKTQFRLSAWTVFSQIDLGWSDANGNSGTWSDTGVGIGADFAVTASIFDQAGLQLRLSAWISNAEISSAEDGARFTAQIPFGGEAVSLLTYRPTDTASLEVGIGVAGARLELESHSNQMRTLSSWTNTWGIAYTGAINIDITENWRTGLNLRVMHYESQTWQNSFRLEPDHTLIDIGLGYRW